MTSNELEIFKQSILDDVRVMMQTTGQVTQYIGARYVPLFADPLDWSADNEYEPLTIVTNRGNSYTSRQFVPRGVELTNEQFWVETGNFNAQIEQYRKEVKAEIDRATSAEGKLKKYIDDIYTIFDNVSQMKKATNLKQGMVVMTLGFYSANDGGGSVYTISENVTADEVDTISCENNLTAVFKAGTYVTPEQFGAVGDGKSDDTKALNKAFEFTNIYFKPNAKYFVSFIDAACATSKIIGNFATLILNSKRSGNLNAEDYYKTILLGNRKNSKTIDYDSFYIENTFFEGSADTFTNYDNYSNSSLLFVTLELLSYKNVKISGCSFNNTIQDAIFCKASNIEISNCTFKNIALTGLSGTKNAITAMANNPKNSTLDVNNCSFDSIQNEVLRIDDFSNVDIVNNSVSNAKQYFIESFWSKSVGENNCNIQNNTVTNLGDCFINVSSQPATHLYINATRNVVTGLMYINDPDKVIYSGNLVQASYPNIDVNFTDNYCHLLKQKSSVFACRNNAITLSGNKITVDTSSASFVSASTLNMVDNDIKCEAANNVGASFIMLSTGKNNIARNNIKAPYIRFIQGNGTELIRLVSNYIEAVSDISGAIISDKISVYNNLIITGNVIPNGKSLILCTSVKNLIYTENIVKNDLNIRNIVVTNKIEDNNLAVL